MPTCPTFPSLPSDLMASFASTRSWNAKLRTYGNDLCASIPEPVDLSVLEQRVANLEASVASLASRMDAVEEASSVSVTTEGITWKAVSTTPYIVTGHGIGLLVVTTTLAITIRLPAASGYAGETIYIKDDSGNAGTNNITVTPDGTDTIDDDPSLVIDSDYAGVQIKSNGTGWEVL